MKPEEVAKLQAQSSAGVAATPASSFGIGKGRLDFKVAVFWLFVGIPLAWSVWVTPRNAMKMF